MALMATFYNGLSGVNTMSERLNVTAHNVANVNTNAFKARQMRFSDVYDTILGATSLGHGDMSSQIATSFASGMLEATGKATDMALSGPGFFMTRRAEATVADIYTRSGNFKLVDNLGPELNASNLITQTGQFVQGYNLSTGSPTVISDILIKNIAPQSATSEVQLVLNLQNNPALQESSGNQANLFDSWNGVNTAQPIATNNYDYKTSLKIYGPADETTGFTTPSATYDLTVYFDATSNPNEQEFLVTCDPTLDQRLNASGSRYDSATDKGAGALLYGVLSFAENGTLNNIQCWNIPPDGNVSPTTPTNQLTLGAGDSFYSFDFNFTGTAANNSSTFNFGNTPGLITTNYASPSSTMYQSQNGYGKGRLQDISMDSQGIISGEYSNGQKIAQAQLALANFMNLQGMSSIGANNFVTTDNAGAITIGTAGQTSFGAASNYGLETSNVDLGRELVDVITTQRAFQANAKSLSTADDLYEKLLQMMR